MDIIHKMNVALLRGHRSLTFYSPVVIKSTTRFNTDVSELFSHSDIQ